MATDLSLDAGAPPAACRHCATALAGRFCHGCGEDSRPPEGRRSLAESWQRVVRTIRSLWLAPGQLTLRHLAGARRDAITPVTLFLNAVAVFFLFSAATQFRLTTLSEQSGPWMQPIIEQRMTETGRSREVVLERAERRFQGIYTVCLAVISGLGYALVYRLLFRRTLPGWRGAFTLSLHYLAFLVTLFLPFMLLLAPLRARFGDAIALLTLVTGIAIALAWNGAAARRIGGHGWPMAIAKGFAVIVAGFFIDSAMSLVAIVLSLRLA